MPALSPTRLFFIFVMIIAMNSIVWLESLDRYFNAQKHIELNHYLPDWLFLPSQLLYPTTQAIAQGLTVHSSTTPEIKSATDKSPRAVISDLAQPIVKDLEESLVIDQSHQKPLVSPKVLFAGDSLMQGVAPLVISELKKIYPDGKYFDLSQQSTGLSVRRNFDWPLRIKEESIKEELNTLVIFLGPNDPWDIYSNKKRYHFPSEDWQTIYRDRVTEILTFAQSRGIHVVWIGLPNMDVERVRAGAIVQNSIFKSETEKFHFDYISSEDLLGNFDEPFKKYIQDPLKGPVLARANDGVHFSVYGYRLIGKQVVSALKNKFAP